MSDLTHGLPNSTLARTGKAALRIGALMLLSLALPAAPAAPMI